MNDINRIKVILVEKRQTEKWLAKRFWKEFSIIFKWRSNTIQQSLKTLGLVAIELGVDRKDLLNKSQY